MICDTGPLHEGLTDSLAKDLTCKKSKSKKSLIIKPHQHNSIKKLKIAMEEFHITNYAWMADSMCRQKITKMASIKLGSISMKNLERSICQ